MQINRIINGRREITTNKAELQRIIRNYYELLYANKYNDFDEIDKFLEVYTHPKLNKDIAQISQSQATKLKLIKNLP